jgi:hypothetical protein
VTKAILNQIKLSYVSGVNISKKDFHNISNIIKRNINIHTKSNNETKTQRIKADEPEEGKEDINIAMYENHYFTYEKTNYTKYSIKNYERVRNMKNRNTIIKISVKNGKEYPHYDHELKNGIDSLSLVEKLYELNLFEKLDMTKFEETAQDARVRDHIYLENIKYEQTEYVNERLRKGDNTEFIEYKNQPLSTPGVSPILDSATPQHSQSHECSTPCGGGIAVTLVGAVTPMRPPIFYADCEAFVKPNKAGENVNHSLYLLGVVDDEDDYVDLYNVMDERYTPSEGCPSEQKLVHEFLNRLTSGGKHPAICYFHNLKYDYFILEKYLNIKSRCEKDNQLYNVVCNFKNTSVEFRDSFKILSFSLSKFGKEFDLPQEIRKKEAIAYVYYTRENNDKVIPAREYRQLLSSKEKVIFKQVVKNDPSYNISDKTFNPLEYYKEYLRLDCLVLKKGIQKFDAMINEVTEGKMNVYDSLTISSLTDKYMTIEGAYNGVYSMKGNLRAYVAQAVYGGRVAVNKKYKKKVIKGKIADYDGVSLYPSAINRLCREKGLPTGPAQRFTQDNLNEWKNKIYSILTIKITKVKKMQQMPFIANKNKDSIQYLNEPPRDEKGELKPIIIDSITLQDYIKFHDIEYEKLDGVYWDEGVNRKMGEVIRRLFNARLRWKETNAALANTIKLMINSAYGKTIMKKTKQDKVIVKTHIYKKINGVWTKYEKTNFDNYVYNNFNTIKSYRQLNENCYEIERIKADNSYNRGHIGCAILSTSKRIMNEVFDVANTNNYPIYYTDTDSLHCNCEDVPKLEAQYKKDYKKELNGKQLEQFHTDFDLNGACGEIYATKSIFLGKKSYIDCLESKDENGNTITGFHTRLKGITKEGLDDQAKKYSNSYLGLYEDLAKGTEIKITLNPFNAEENKQKVLFKFKNGNVSHRENDAFTRNVKF